MKTRSLGIICVCAIALVCLACDSHTCSQKETSITFLTAPGAESQSLPFSEAVRVGDILFLSGQIGRAPGASELVPGGITEETQQTLENIKDALERHGSSLDRVVKCTVFLVDIAEWPTMNETYRTYFPNNPPARSAMAASGLAMGARVEIECIAVVAPSSDAE